MVKPIPKHVLIHTVTYEEWQDGDGINTESGFKSPVTLSNVRVQALSNIRKNTNSEELLYEAILFYDVVNSSSSAAFNFAEKSRVTFDGKQLLVKKVNPVEALTLHHYEIGLT
ncbi:putative minor capsid protein [Cytobacillus oceanisediminis]|uniref:putative minor capsid protein n=1 Tax=Cytobacillus oceanisediminis TaxID=665099 RepID=UPI001C22DDE5|nr:putative minor capsid protein [Cytobacillus oceanisediminis]MBU8773188.1 minor capsid protein [Cytobacillus oceanisediminis]